MISRRFVSFCLVLSLLPAALVTGCKPRKAVKEEEEVARILSFKKELTKAQTEEKNGDLLLARKHYREVLEDVPRIRRRPERPVSADPLPHRGCRGAAQGAMKS